MNNTSSQLYVTYLHPMSFAELSRGIPKALSSMTFASMGALCILVVIIGYRIKKKTRKYFDNLFILKKWNNVSKLNNTVVSIQILKSVSTRM